MSNNTIVLQSDDFSRLKGETTKRAFVVVLAGDRMGEMFPLNDGRTTIGRGLQTDVRINDEGISRTHAMIELADGMYYLNDAGSTNGTYSNGTKVDRSELSEGDKIQIGATSVLKFTYHDDLDEDFQRSLYESALRDRLTGIFNRGYFNNRLESDLAFALRHGKPLTLLIFDIDHFKAVNDTYGHPVGDTVLRELAQRVQETTRSEDIFARYGGEEFVLICRDVDAIRGARAAHRVRELVRSKPFNTEDKPLDVTISLGLADIAMLEEPSANALVAAADNALYAAKRNGRDRIEIYDPTHDRSGESPK